MVIPILLLTYILKALHSPQLRNRLQPISWGGGAAAVYILRRRKNLVDVVKLGRKAPSIR